MISDFAPRRRRPTRRVRTTMLALVGAVWLAVGGFGAWSQAHDFTLYRGFAPLVQPVGTPSGSERYVSFTSSALHARRNYWIYLPPGYAAAAARGTRFPVLYLLSGPGSAHGYFDIAGLDVRMNELIATHSIRPFIVVEPKGGPMHTLFDTEWANANKGRYEDFVVDTVHAVDQRWSTVADRRSRTIAGVSMGGYGAVNIALHHLSLVGNVQAWSGYFSQTATYAFTGATPAQVRANNPLQYVGGLRTQLARYPLRAYLYQGRSDHESNPKEMIDFATKLRAAGGQVNATLVPGNHNWKLWRDQLPRMLRLTDGWFSTAGGR